MADGSDNKGEPGVDELRDQLDALWEKHLTLLDSYHQAQQQIARHFSSGFFDLAQATFKSTTRVRYGQESYDDRMQAITRFDTSVDDHDIPCLALKVNDTTPQSTTGESTKSADDRLDEKLVVEEDVTPSQQPTPPSTPPRESDEELLEKQSQENKSDTTGDKEPSQKKVRDPIHWYGILVPPSLRSSQKSFKSAIQDPIIEAANSAQALRHINMEIRKLRKDIKKAEKRVS
ncbi:unnamed protein product [Aureobasidium mustum]|uniref:Vacuolar ATPase assembly protein VMA22 n=1 Tax=Aureobasidium mustum TaxID=2773714 RepID=A0A9N8K6V3_9PEZI|nr:unnamed protein product [Aureobasidium mustum]